VVSSAVSLTSSTSFIPVVNIVLAFHMGNDLQSVIANPIGQPMATVCSAPFDEVDIDWIIPRFLPIVWALLVLSLFGHL
jgi:hypothetical protein